MTSELTWTGSPDDQAARIEKNREEINNLMFSNLPLDLIYMRVRMLSKQNKRLIQAKTACEKAYYEHLKTNL